MRIDVFLAERGFCQSRTEAKNLINSGSVEYLGKVITKASYDIPEDAKDIKVDRSSIRFVSRGGEKLAFALAEFEVSASGRYAIDVGASSGGFTDCLLQNGASHVLSVDTGSGQLADALRRDPRVSVYEGYNARYMKREDFDYVPDLAVMDVSFISQTYILPQIPALLVDGGIAITLIKPQFEVGKSGVGKCGIVRHAEDRRAAVLRVVEAARQAGLYIEGLIHSPICGGDGNREYLALFSTTNNDKTDGIVDSIKY
jgi:23S rRNA (cytidine1920-2'-O)/16S rRNA (cytidine1409-2'-O)-methyltransferase